METNRKYYICAIGNMFNEKITNYKVGTFDKERQTFSFSNGAYANTELKFRESIGSSYCCVLLCKNIDDIELLKEPKDAE